MTAGRLTRPPIRSLRCGNIGRSRPGASAIWPRSPAASWTHREWCRSTPPPGPARASAPSASTWRAGLVSPPDGRGTAAVYSYRHLLQVLAIKLRQMEGATLESMLKEFAGLTGDLIERRAASALGPGLPPPDHLPLLRTPGTGRGPGGPGGHGAGWRRSRA